MIVLAMPRGHQCRITVLSCRMKEIFFTRHNCLQLYHETEVCGLQIVHHFISIITCLDVLGQSLMCIFWSSPYRIRSDQIFSFHLLHSATFLKKSITNQSLVPNQTTQWLWLAGTTLHSQSTKEIWWKHQQTWTSSHWQSRWTYRWSQFE